MRTLEVSLLVFALPVVVACTGEPVKDPSGPSVASGANAPASSVPASMTAPSSSAPGAPPAPSAASSPAGRVAPPPAPKAEEPITSVRVYLSNKCSQKVEYCVEDVSTLNTSLGGNTSTTHSVKPGAKFRLKNGSSCGMTVFTAPASRDEVKASICEK